MNKARLTNTLAAFDKENAQDPNRKLYHGIEYPKELLYAQRMTETLKEYEPKASESLHLAARCQHIRRWEIERSAFPEGRKGYLLWRTKLQEMHATLAAEIMQRFGYDQTEMEQVQKMLLKKELKDDPEAQTLQDVVCLVFLKYYFQEFATKHESEKVKCILEQTIRKMSDKGLSYAKKLENAAEFLAAL